MNEFKNQGFFTILNRGSSWLFLFESLKAASQLIITIILARLLSPSDFGVVAVALVCVSIIESFSEFGIQTTLIQRVSRDPRSDRITSIIRQYTIDTWTSRKSEMMQHALPSSKALSQQHRKAPIGGAWDPWERYPADTRTSEGAPRLAADTAHWSLVGQRHPPPRVPAPAP